MAKVKDKTNAKRQREFQARRKQQEEDRATLAAMFAASAPDGIGEHIGIRLAVEDGEDRLVWDLDDVGAAFLTEFAASLPVSSDQAVPTNSWVMAQLSLHFGKKLMRREYDWQKGEADDGQTTQAS